MCRAAPKATGPSSQVLTGAQIGIFGGHGKPSVKDTLGFQVLYAPVGLSKVRTPWAGRRALRPAPCTLHLAIAAVAQFSDATFWRPPCVARSTYIGWQGGSGTTRCRRRSIGGRMR